MRHLRTFHLVLGVIGVIAFLLTGQYMRHVLGALVGMPDGPRLMYRSAHIYLLWASLINLLLGSYLLVAIRGIPRFFQLLASALVLAAPVLIGYSFFVESTYPELLRAVGAMGIQLSAFGSVIHACTAVFVRSQHEQPVRTSTE